MTLADLMPNDERLSLMQNGITQLDQWLTDILQVGLLKIDFDYSFDQIISRMVDAKLGGIANRLSRIKTLDPANSDWLDMVTQELSLVFALSWDLKKLEHLPQKRQLALLGYAGLNFRKTNVAQLPGVSDAWLLLGQHQRQEDNLTRRTCWFFGRQTHRSALVLDFAFGRQRFENTYRLGQHYRGRMHYYPALLPMRALLADATPARFGVQSLPGFDDLSRYVTKFTKALCTDPWLSKFPANFNNVTIQQIEQRFFVVDSSARSILISNNAETSWRLLALAGGLPITLFGEYDGRTLHVFSLLMDDRVVSIDTNQSP